VILGGLGVGVYFGAPYVYDRLILPTETNAARLAELEDRQAADIVRVNEQIVALQGRIDAAENRMTEDRQAVSEVQGKIRTLEAAISRLEATSAEQQALLVGGDSLLAALQREIVFMRAAEVLARSRLSLLQSNFGLAREDVQTARDILTAVQPEVPEAKQASLRAVIGRLDLALSNLPAFPVIAADDVNIAWQLLVEGLEEEEAIPAPEVTENNGTGTTTNGQEANGEAANGTNGEAANGTGGD
jgi:chromosome segregation ATPase